LQYIRGWVIAFFFFFEGSCYVVQAGLKLLGSRDLFTSSSLVVGTTAMHHHTKLVMASWQQREHFHQIQCPACFCIMISTFKGFQVITLTKIILISLVWTHVLIQCTILILRTLIKFPLLFALSTWEANREAVVWIVSDWVALVSVSSCSCETKRMGRGEKRLKKELKNITGFGD
jgi:hypothetical protein